MVSKRVKLLDIQLELINRGENSKMLKNMLLKADTLLNDYAYKYPDLALRIIDIYNLKDKNAIKETWIKALDCDLKKSLQFIVMNNFSGNAFDIEILGNIFLEKMTKNDSLSHLLYSVGFSFYDIQKFIENKIHMESDLETRNWFLDDFQNFSNDKKSICRLEQTCISKS
ncbi:nuclear pore complex protein nup155 [Vairimorpha apis BRL 01]|uniref:Nuclear pore complex protein nup155 n=1 Tax=Vairimorpha apis BRL 01 TaxID=1037528 RepID=T0MK00_9MICR|nr:nuclear pore complex protein nup155 [Vairimorpha apis BRL 01]